MTLRTTAAVLLVAAIIYGCSPGKGTSEVAADTPDSSTSDAEPIQIVPGLTMKKLENGYGRAAAAGDFASVHYTGWLYDETAADGRGQKFDSSVDRGRQFEFELGAGSVIEGWDKGVVGMLIGEKRELLIAPKLGYGDRGAAGGVIPPGATLLFEVELKSLRVPGE